MSGRLMYVKRGDDIKLKRSLSRLAIKMPKESAEIMARGAADIYNKAKSNAPVDDGYLENAITKEKVSGGRIGGRFAPTIYDIFVDLDKLNPRAKGKPYNLYMELGRYKELGPKSLAKKARGHDVGAFYMARAFEEIGPKIEEELVQLMKSLTL